MVFFVTAVFFFAEGFFLVLALLRAEVRLFADRLDWVLLFGLLGMAELTPGHLTCDAKAFGFSHQRLNNLWV